MKDIMYINEFIKNVFEDNLADAQKNLESAINEKVKGKMKEYMLEKKYVPSDDDAKFEKMKKAKKGFKKGSLEKSNKPNRGSKDENILEKKYVPSEDDDAQFEKFKSKKRFKKDKETSKKFNKPQRGGKDKVEKE